MRIKIHSLTKIAMIYIPTYRGSISDGFSIKPTKSVPFFSNYEFLIEINYGLFFFLLRKILLLRNLNSKMDINSCVKVKNNLPEYDFNLLNTKRALFL